jgi:hypothetical protein
MSSTAPKGELTPDYPYAERKEDVERVPDWAESFGIGDTIRWETELFEEEQESEVVGFSPLYVGLPVIAAPAPPESATQTSPALSVVVDKDCWAGNTEDTGGER